ncbi:PIN2/TERF1-interacting telomerase inhibitor 1 isoform X1 [Crotalus tigris]|uniref:PIN2/TERF1-interacting telomerase inhibitor 1 isoform X1 n=1 Tax=Crotalus tigris TaxID=88082 RepID=UPI00192F2F8E|nr:PIN2/TERF1-interacting telomerase inhibitor 1 isoform X1 [Crotalus tigris]
MAMLAEPRRKLKWSVDPRNSAWSKDESKFGQKMLEKMGWSKGKGLGAQEQGNTEHITVQVKNNTLGLGASVSQEDNWIAHQDDFNQLLAELNNCYAQDDPESTCKDKKKTFNLEEKSKTSKKRVHYVKFAKGKDLSSRSEDDLSCIFGKRKIKKMQVDAAGTGSPVEDSKEAIVPSDQVDKSNTVTSPLTVQEYFAMCMTKLKKTQHYITLESANSPLVVAEKLECLESQTKKKKRHKHAQDEAEEPKIICTGILCSSKDEVDIQKKKKKQKSKHQETSSGLIYNESQSGSQKAGQCSFDISKDDNDLGEQKSKRRKKSKKSRLGCN